jgi:hypothetical protein
VRSSPPLCSASLRFMPRRRQPHQQSPRCQTVNRAPIPYRSVERSAPAQTNGGGSQADSDS